MSTTADELREQVRRRYAEAAGAATEGNGQLRQRHCCEHGESDAAKFAEALYDAEERSQLPRRPGSPRSAAATRPQSRSSSEGETVLDLGSGGGIDVILSAKRVGPTGRAFGLDMTDEMLALARAERRRGGRPNVDFLKGDIETIPLPADSVDVVISNCVINLSTDKPAVLAEIARVSSPAAGSGISDIVAEDHLTPEQRAERGSLRRLHRRRTVPRGIPGGPRGRRLRRRPVAFTHEVADGMHGAIVKAVKTTATRGG